MIRRTTLLSCLTLSLLLGACTSKDKDEAAASETAATQADENTSETETAAAPPPPKFDVWKIVGPIVAGDYSGNCMRGLDKVNATVKLGGDGKASAGDIQADFGTTEMAILRRVRENGQFGLSASLAVDKGDGNGFSLAATPKGGSVSLGNSERNVVCGDVQLPATKAAQPMYTAVTHLVEGKKQTVSCVGKEVLVRHDTDVQVANGVVTIGKDSWDMKEAVSEGFDFKDGGESLSLSAEMADGRQVMLVFDGSGKIIVATAFNKDGTTHQCSEAS